MIAVSLSVTALAAFTLSVFFAWVIRTSRYKRYPLPPGPNASWWGSVALPKEHQWRTYAAWKETYGDMIYLHIFGNPIIVLNTAQSVNDLLEKRSANYSSRPVRTMANELMGWDWIFSSMPYGTSWRKHRTIFHQYFNGNDTSRYHSIQLEETHTLLQNLLDSPEKYSHHIRRSAAASVMRIAYGHQIAPEGDKFVTLADTAISGLAKAGIYGTFLVDYIPLLKYVPPWMPGAYFKRLAQECRGVTRAMLDEPYNMVRKRMATGTAVPCLLTEEIEKWLQTGQDPEDERIIKDVAAIAYAAGADTTVSAVLSFFLAMSVHPEIRKKAQMEIDAVIGSNRLPDFSDRHSLPYIDRIVWECLRWNPVTPLSLAHRNIEDDEYKGYYIPKGTTILPNVWGIFHDETTYPDPHSFNPDRFADETTNNEQDINALPLFAFGFGRRMCPGRWFAIDTIWITVATVLAVFDISQALDSDGVPIQSDLEYTSALLSRPKPFKCSIVPRSQAAVTLAKQATEL